MVRIVYLLLVGAISSAAALASADKARVDAVKQLEQENRRAEAWERVSEALQHDPQETPTKALERATESILDAVGLHSGKQAQRDADKLADLRRLNEIVVANYTKDAVAARASWERLGVKLYDVLRRLGAATIELQRLKKEISDGKTEHRKLEHEKEQATEELKRGDFCSGCGDTRSKIEASGQRFPHPGQVRRPALKSDFDKLEQKYAGLLGKLKAKLSSLEDAVKQKGRDARDLHFQFVNDLPIYHREINREEELRLRAWNTEKEFLEKQLRGIDTRLAELRKASSGQNGARVAASASQALERDLGDHVRRAESHFLRAQQEASTYVQAATRDMQRLSEVARPVVETDGVPNGMFLGQTILSTPLPVSCRIYPVQRKGGAADGPSLLDRAEMNSKGPPVSQQSARELLESR